MKKKSILSIFICVLVNISSYSQIRNYDNSICWEITSSKLSKPAYILGSIHALDTTKIYFPTLKIKEMIDQCGSYCMETVLDSIQMKETFNGLFLDNKKKNNRDSLGHEYYEKLIHIADSSKERMLTTFKIFLPILEPGFISFMLKSRRLSINRTLYSKSNFKMDLYFEKYSTSKNYSIHGLESPQQVLDYLVGKATYRESILALKTSIDDFLIKPVELSNDHVDIFKSYANQNLSFLKNDAYLDSTLIMRNKVMADGIDQLLQEKPVFIVIGASHLPYEFGVLNRLAQKGYSVQPYNIELQINKETNN